jgi:hypothetical protein
MSFTVYGKVIGHSNHGEHATVAIAPDLEDERNASWLAGGGVEAPFLSIKVNAETAELPELAEGSAVAIGFSAAGGPAKSKKAAADTPPA